MILENVHLINSNDSRRRIMDSNNVETQAVEETVLTDGFHLVVDALKLNGIDTIYGVAGIPITDLARLWHSEGLTYIGCRHESNAGQAAAIAGYITQKPGICLTVSAPGFLNGLVALANATVNCFPMILISGSSDRAKVDLKKGEYEELDQMNAAKEYAKAVFRVNKPEDIGVGVARAIRAAVSGRPGGVYLDLTHDVLASVMDAVEGQKSLIKVVDAAPASIPAPESITRAVDLLKSAKKPLFLLGKGAAYAQADDSIRELIEKTGVPYLPMSMAKGLLPDTHEQSAAAARSYVLGSADVVVLVGARLNWLLSHGQAPVWNPNVQFVQLDIEANEMDSNKAIAAPVVGDIKSSVAALLKALESTPVQAPAEWVEAVQLKKQVNFEKAAKRQAADPSPMNYTSALMAIKEAMTPEVYLVNEGANALDFTRNTIDMSQPRKRLDTGTWGVMGIGMGYAIAAAVQGDGAPVVAIEGDSAFGFSMNEIETICRYDLPVTTVIFNNNGIYRGDAPGTKPSPTGLLTGARYDQMIEAFGGKGYHVETKAQLTAALKEAIALRKPALINVVIDPTAGTESGNITHLNPKSALMK
jgi:oxalyl-CoA decarboxylase